MANSLLTRLVKIGLFACLALTAWKGLVKLPEIASVTDPERFYRAMVNEGEVVLIMKERHFDFNYQTGKALELRMKELADAPAPQDAREPLVTPERARAAYLKSLAKRVRDADYVLLAKEKLERAKLLRDARWTPGWSVANPTPRPAAPVDPLGAPLATSTASPEQRITGQAVAGAPAKGILTGVLTGAPGAAAPAATAPKSGTLTGQGASQ